MCEPSTFQLLKIQAPTEDDLDADAAIEEPDFIVRGEDCTMTQGSSGSPEGDVPVRTVTVDLGEGLGVEDTSGRPGAGSPTRVATVDEQGEAGLTLQDRQAMAKKRRQLALKRKRRDKVTPEELVARRLTFLDAKGNTSPPTPPLPGEKPAPFAAQSMGHSSMGYIGHPTAGLNVIFLNGTPEARMKTLLGAGYDLVRPSAKYAWVRRPDAAGRG